MCLCTYLRSATFCMGKIVRVTSPDGIQIYVREYDAILHIPVYI